MATTRSGRAFDVVIYGATGFTGTLVARYLAFRAPPSLRWAVGGRNRPALEALVAKLEAKHPAWRGQIGVVVGAGSTAIDVARSSKVVITTAGPYSLHGEPLLAACVEAGTDYCDLTGETPWSAAMIAKYESRAAATGAAIIHQCGYDSIPLDMGTFFLIDAAKRYAGADVNEVRGYMYAKGAASGGTIASGLAIMSDRQASATAADPFTMFPTAAAANKGFSSPAALVRPMSDGVWPGWSSTLDVAFASSLMAGINTRVVRRTVGLLAAYGDKLVGHPAAVSRRGADAASVPAQYAPLLSGHTGTHPTTTVPDDGRYCHTPFGVQEVFVAPGRVASFVLSVGIALFGLLSYLPFLVPLLRRIVPPPGTGPSERDMSERHWFHYIVEGKTEEPTPRTVIARVSGTDGGYADTALMIAETGLMLALEREAAPVSRLGGGFWTTAVAGGHTLLRRLTAAGLQFHLLSLGAQVPAEQVRGTRRPPFQCWLKEAGELK